jgi:hypothetical protein
MTQQVMTQPHEDPGTCKVLYVDDEPTLLDLGKIFLEATGEYRIETTTSVAGALSFAGYKKI